jgi:hypothetical protein
MAADNQASTPDNAQLNEINSNSKKIQKAPKSVADCTTTVFTEFQ